MSTKKKSMNLTAKPAPSMEEFINGTTPAAAPAAAPAPTPQQPVAHDEQEAPKRGRPAGQHKSARNIKIEDGLYKQAKYLAVDRGVSFSDLVAIALEEYLERSKP